MWNRLAVGRAVWRAAKKEGSMRTQVVLRRVNGGWVAQEGSTMAPRAGPW